MAVETRIIIDANASNAIKEIGKLDDAAGDADTTIKALDDQTVTVDTSQGVDGMDELRRMGDEAIASVKALDDQSVSIDVDVDTTELDTLDTNKLDRVKQSADDVAGSGRAASTAIGGIGNTVSGLPGIGALGPMAETMGQLTEGALEGEVALGELAATAGGLALVALAAKGIQGHFEKIAQTKAFREDQVKKWSDALREGKTLLEGINDELAETGKLEFQGWDGVVDIVPILADLNLKTTDWTAAVEGNEAAQHSFIQTVIDNGASQEQQREIMVALKTEVDNYTESQKRASDAAKVGATETDKTVGSWHAARDAVKDLASGLDDATLATKQLEDANARLRGDLDKREAYLNLMDQFDELKAKGQEAWDATASGAADAEAKARDYEQAQIDTKNAVLDYTETVGEVPTDVTTNLIAEVDAGQVNSLKADIDEMTSGPKYVDLRIRTTVDNAWNNVMNSVRLGGSRT